MCRIHNVKIVRTYNTVLGRYIRECPECAAESHARMNTADN